VSPDATSNETADVGLDQRMLDGAQLVGALRLLGSADPLCAAVPTHLNLRLYPAPPDDTTATAYVVLDIHGVSLGLQRRSTDLYLHADTTETGDRCIAFEINGGGEIDHPTA
jgi:hypothetical protein